MNENLDITQHRLPKVLISILNWNGWQETLDCLRSVRRLDYPDYLAIVIDNGSSNDSAERIKAWAEENLGSGHVVADYRRETALAGGEAQTEQALERSPSPARLVLIRNEENRGFTGGHNVGIHYALHRPQPADSVLLLNNDAIVERDCLTRLWEAAQVSGAGIVGALIKDEKSGQVAFMGCDDSVPLTRQLFHPLIRSHPALTSCDKGLKGMNWVSGAAMLIGRGVLQDIFRARGCYLDDKLFLYGEDVEICEAARRAGHRIVMAPRAVIYHEAASSSGGQFNPLAYYYQSRNRIFLARGNLAMPGRACFHLLNGALCSARILKNLATGRTHAALAIFQGMMDAYRGIGGKWRHHDREARQGGGG